MNVRPMPSRGVYERPFWRFVGQEQLHLQKCADCGHVWYPPGPSCPSCLSRSWNWTPLAGGGTVVSWATFHRQYFPTIPAPYTIVAVELEEGPILITDIDSSPAELSIGLEARLTYRPAQSDQGEEFMLYHWAIGTPETALGTQGQHTEEGLQP